MTKLDQAVILITGASGGFGQEFIKQLLAKNSRLILTDINQEKLISVVDSIQSEVKTGEVIACFQSDLGNPKGSDLLFNLVQKIDIPVDIVINNAGVAIYGRMDEVPRAEWEKLMLINLLTPMRLCSLFARVMIPRKKGHIVNISSIAGWVAASGLAHYSTSKFGLRGFSEGLARELKPYNIKVSTVYPFFSRTPIIKSKAYGSLAENYQGFPDKFATNPEQVIANVIKGISQNKSAIFPDKIAYTTHLLKRYLPSVCFLTLDRFNEYVQNLRAD